MNKLTKQRAPFTQVPNALLTDPEITLKAKGLYALMYSKPDGWQFYETAIAKECREGKEAVSAGLDELVKSGWLRRSGGRQERTNRFCAYDYEILASRDGLAVTENPSRESRDGKPATTNTEPSKTDEAIPPIAPKGAWSGFDKFWSAYPNRVGKPKAVDAWNRKKPDLDLVLAAIAKWKGSEQWTKDGGRFIPHPTTWLNREGWNDQIAGDEPAMTAADIEAANARFLASERAHKARMQALVEARIDVLKTPMD